MVVMHGVGRGMHADLAGREGHHEERAAEIVARAAAGRWNGVAQAHTCADLPTVGPCKHGWVTLCDGVVGRSSVADVTTSQERKEDRPGGRKCT